MQLHIDDPFYDFIGDYARAVRTGEDTAHFAPLFRDIVWLYYKKHKRVFAWRNTDNLYHVVVSELMLQQTQTQRAAEKFPLFLEKFPTFQALADAPTAAVISAWVGLGYNRRALALQGIAQKVVRECNGVLPNDPLLLIKWKGLGPATAASIVAFAFNKPNVFIETNIRAVYLHAFFNGQEQVHDKELVPLITATLDYENPREWYYALMDCGVLLKKLYKNPSRKSRHHTKQSKFEGSDRQLRGAVIRLLSKQSSATQQQIDSLCSDMDRLEKITQGLYKEGFVVVRNGVYSLAQ